MKASRLTVPQAVPSVAAEARMRSRPVGGFVLGLLVALACAGASSASLARERTAAAAAVVEEVPGVIHHDGAGQRRAELRRALISGAELPRAAAGERRRLSAEQRDALNQELREAMREAYRQRGVAGH